MNTVQQTIALYLVHEKQKIALDITKLKSDRQELLKTHGLLSDDIEKEYEALIRGITACHIAKDLAFSPLEIYSVLEDLDLVNYFNE